MILYFNPSILAGFVCVLLLYYLHQRRRRHPLQLPPGPKGYPLIGNALDMPTNAMYEKYHEWCQMHGSDIIYLNVAGRNMIILDSSEAAIELLDRRSSIYSDRPRMTMLTEVVQCTFTFGFIPYGERWRRQRKLVHQVFHPKLGKDLRPHLLKCTHSLLRRFLEKPGDVMAHLRHLAGETIITIAYGLDVLPENDPYLRISEEGTHAITAAAVPGAFLVDSLPFLKYVPEWVPGAGFKKKAREWRVLLKTMVELPFSAAMQRIQSGNFMPSLVSDCLSKIDEKEDCAWQEWLIKSTAGTLYSAGSSTTASAMGTCIVALLKHPHILKRAQDQIDSVLPLGELPTFELESKLPIITAICMEAMRWRDVAPLSIPHFLTQDDVYKGYRLPKGSVVVPNAWAMLHDERVYPDPFEFKPDRFLKDGKINEDIWDPRNATFGFGRRTCPAKDVAWQAVWITIASLIASCDIANYVDSHGNVIETDPPYERNALIVKPRAFECSIKPRSKIHEQAIFATAIQEYQFDW